MYPLQQPASWQSKADISKMSDSGAGPPGGRVSPSPGPARRPRAPTITIDTSAVQRSPSRVSRDPEHEMEHLSDDGRSVHEDRSSTLRPSSNAHSTPTELRASNSFDSRESRPTSPHNVSSPTQWNHPQAFLTVPTTRSRGASFDTDASGEGSSVSDVTYVNSQTPLNESPPKAFGDHDKKRWTG